MPYRKRAPKRVAAKKRIYRRKRIMRRRQNNPSKMVFRPRKNLGAVCPERYITKLKATWVAVGSMTSGQLLYQVHGNSPYDYKSTSGTDNAAGFSQLATLYDKYVCYGSKINIQSSASTTAGLPAYCVLYPVSGVSPSNLRSSIDMPYAKTQIIGQGQGTSKIRMSQYMSTKRITGAKDIKDEKELTALTSAVPTQTWSWVYLLDNGTGSGTEAYTNLITITYYVEFFDRVSLNES